MSTYYVRKTGNDTSGDGSSVNPWLTISKAFLAVSSGDTIKVGSGTYNESTSGLNFFYLNRVFESFVTIESESGLVDVVLSNNSHVTYSVRINVSAYVKFRNIKITPAATCSYSVFFQDANGTNHIEFENCVIEHVSDGSTRYCVYGAMTGTNSISDISFVNCQFQKTGTGFVTSVYFSRSVITASISNITLTNCAAYNDGGILFLGVENVLVEKGSITSTAALNNALYIGNDALTGLPASGIVTGVAITGLLAHGLIVGAGAHDTIVSQCCVSGKDNSIVIKENTGTEIKNCLVLSGTASGIYCKAATNANIHHNTIRAYQGVCFKLNEGDTGNKSGNCTVKNNRMYSFSDGEIFLWGGAAGDSGGCICDENTYKTASAGKFGSVKSDTDVRNLMGLRSAWSGYGDSTNDSKSRMKPNSDFILLR